MVSLPLLAELFCHVRPDAMVVLVGDPDQLASIEVGAVLADVVRPRDGGDTHGVAVSSLTVAIASRTRRGLRALADAVRRGTADGVEAVREYRRRRARRSGPLAEASSTARSPTPLLSSRRRAPATGPEHSSSSPRSGCSAPRDGARLHDLLAPGDRATARGARRDPRARRRLPRTARAGHSQRPLDRAHERRHRRRRCSGAERVCVFDAGSFPLSSVPSAETVWSLTIHKSQGSEYDEVVVSLPARTSPILTRELLYTALRAARRTVTCSHRRVARCRARAASRVEWTRGAAAPAHPDRRRGPERGYRAGSTRAEHDRVPRSEAPPSPRASRACPRSRREVPARDQQRLVPSGCRSPREALSRWPRTTSGV